jgi:hypothetical protein
MAAESAGNRPAIAMRAILHILALVFALAFIALAGEVSGRLLGLRKQYRLDQTDPLLNSPPLVAFTTVALGGFRGILADILWVRASKLQEEGKYFELVQLSDWITKLEPRFTPVWAFHAWNMAYNISVLFNNPADRWRWVRHGISLLRDEGLRYNAGDAQLFRELGWLFQHKIGGNYDEAHLYYKEQWAREMGALFDGPRPDYAALERAQPGTPEYAAGRRLIEVYKLDPALMQRVDDTFGPFDWRLPWAHALYWAWQGKNVASGFEAVAADRMIAQSLGESFRQGRLFINTNENIFIPTPDLDLFGRVDAAYRQALAEHPDQDTIKTAHQNFLREAMILLYSYHRVPEAQAAFEELKRRYPADDTGPGFEAYIFRAFSAAMQDLTDRDTVAMIEGAAYQSLYWLALGDAERATGFDQLARLCWKQYMAERLSPELRKRTGLPPYEDIRARARERVRETLTNAATRARLQDDEAGR